MDSQTLATQVLDRVLRILDQLSHYGARGLSLSDIACQSGIPHPGVHWLLQDMAAARLAALLSAGIAGIQPRVQLHWSDHAPLR